MPMHTSWLPREGFTSDALFKLIGQTALNPFFVLPALLLARFTEKGGELAEYHPTAFSRVKTLFYLGALRYVNRFISNRALNNWTKDRYDWSKEVVLITGGAGGIGGHVVQLLAEKGVTVVVLDIQPLTYSAPSHVHFYNCDITSTSKVAAVAQEIRKKVGHPTILINNAGVARGKSIMESTERDVRFTFDVNTMAHFWIVKEFLPAIVANNHGMVVTVASFAAWLTAPNMVDYAASKAAALAFHEGLTAELTTRYNAPRVRTVIVNQGYTKTSLFTGYLADSQFMVPALEPETVAQKIAEQVLSGDSGQIVTPAIGNYVASLRGFPHWLQLKARKDTEKLMTNFSGRQVVKDLDKFYTEKDREIEGSGVLVPENKRRYEPGWKDDDSSVTVSQRP